MDTQSPTASEHFLYRFDIYLPLRDKDGRRIEPSKFLGIKNEIVREFGGLTMTSIWGNPVYDGFWRSSKTQRVVKDKNSIFTVLVPQSEDSIGFFLSRKEPWRTGLHYEELLITCYELQTV